MSKKRCLFCNKENVGENDLGFGECSSKGHTFCNDCMGKYVEYEIFSIKKFMK